MTALTAHELALLLAEQARAERKTFMERFLARYSLSSAQGLSMMSMAEALLRIPDKATAQALIADRLGNWGFLAKTPFTLPLANRLMRAMATQFTMAETIDAAMLAAAETPQQRYSFDMLGEAARTEAQAHHYFEAYSNAIHVVGNASASQGPEQSQGVSIKLSALYSRFELLQMETGFPVLYERIKNLAQLAKSYQIGMTLDAEEVDRLDYQLALFERLMQEKSLQGWDGLGIAVQAYQTRSYSVLKTLIQWTKQYQRRIMIRLVKGAYWDTEIKRAQMMGLPVYPVFTRKSDTDASYLKCAKLLRAHTESIYAQFATHNAITLAEILLLFRGVKTVEIQRLYGMGKAMHEKATEISGIASRVYAPVGGYRHLVAYLVRRLLENGANTSFLNHVQNISLSLDDVLAETSDDESSIPLPCDLYQPERLNSRGEDLGSMDAVAHLVADIQKQLASMPWKAASLLAHHPLHTPAFAPRLNPAQRSEVIGQVALSTALDVPLAFESAHHAFHAWAMLPVVDRAKRVRRVAELLESHRHRLYGLLMKESGKTLANAISEVREAVDFCRYYAAQAEELMATPDILPGPTGELNQFSYRARGVIVCISPWNFPLAIFTGQIMAALVLGNTVVAKPAKQTPLIAHEAVRLFHEAGIPGDVLQLLIGDSSVIGPALLGDSRIDGVIMTGSLDTARLINQTLAQKPGPIVPLIAETGGVNAMIMDSSALLEQSVYDVVQSAFDSAGQRCSALRVLFVQEEIADPFLEMLRGAIDMLAVGDPMALDTDIGPVIDVDALNKLEGHAAQMSLAAHRVYHGKLPAEKGFFFPPTLCEISNLNILKGEVFGPILHVIRYRAETLKDVMTAINGMGYGLTFGVQSRLESRANALTDAIAAGNAYVNRNMIGAVVGVQPFGGQGMSGTGPKAGGPNYLHRLVHERVKTVNTAALGGDVSLLGHGPT